jgi:hypothetical protein
MLKGFFNLKIKLGEKTKNKKISGLRASPARWARLHLTLVATLGH